ncbi:NAD(P)-dependent oxidoreductase [Actinopolymorpha alba]|uniref:NAD(P)-dependent oxidoreductase n=1 Tax=Actinopolymorpha alba TaxID=533267 RepID=UPI0003678E65|nr:NAD(P)-dependent oxidoreductase [Actinopolymorpha alba]
MVENAVAVIGAGTMGSAMVGALRRANRPVFVYNRTRARALEVAAMTGAVAVNTPREAAARADVVLVSLANDEAVIAVHEGEDGLAAGVSEGAVLVETSTVAPETVRQLTPAIEARSAALLDAPVSGSVQLVEHGELTVMVGGDPEVLDRVRPVLDILARRVIHVGEIETGSVMKLAVNSALGGLNSALAEALVLAERAGIARATAYDVLEASAIAAPFVHYKRDAFVRPEDAPVDFSLRLLAKDLDLADALARRVQAPLEQLPLNRRLVHEAADAGYSERDLSALAAYLRESRDGQPS